ncbi:hypothetical protein SynWH8101_1514 [Synechococcus sp. WH 8101]|uniref:DUF3593 domain-containing protein n=1 Tax=Synechococcus sp. WH 8101 TaxID=59932 RepID=UPI001022F3EA|nr:DUF3593 domain-containing protein [Synechococcus sp. WH 8101]QBE69097.1 hypothetical protein SynWH8101_1514 [Synechococcus sp. WH 8101]QNI45328.1 uncharacterized conserved membrane protein (DUF3593) [Synechococcus sp. WH 8101]
MNPDQISLAIAAIDPAPLFALSLFPYLLFLWWAQRRQLIPRLSLLGFQLTLLFVAVTIAAALFADLRFGAELVEVDGLHGGAEAFLTLSNAVIVAGLIGRLRHLHQAKQTDETVDSAPKEAGE